MMRGEHEIKGVVQISRERKKNEWGRGDHPGVPMVEPPRKERELLRRYWIDL